MELRDVLARRRMVRSFRPDPIPRETLERIAGVVRRAPSAGFSQGHRLVVVTEAATRREIGRLAGEEHYSDPWISSAPVHLVVGVSEEDYHRRYREPDKLRDDGTEIDWPVPYWFVDAGAFFALLQLAAIDEGLASGFFGVPDREALERLLGLPDDVTAIGALALGFAAGDDPVVTSRLTRRRKRFDELVRFERWS